MPSQYQISPWNTGLAYQQYDVVYGLFIGSTTNPSAYYYATQNSIGQFPSGSSTYNIATITSSEDVAVVTFNQNAIMPNVQPGSIVSVNGTASNNYTGMAIGGGSGWFSYINPGFDDVHGAGGTVTIPNAAWTTGFCFIPSYATKIPTQNKPITTPLGNGYSQQQPRGLNNFDQSPTFVYENIDKRQTKAITHFVQDAAGVWPFEVLIPDQYLNNQPHQKFFADSVEADPVSFQRYNVTVALRRSFNL